MLNSLIDVVFIRDLQRSFAHECQTNLLQVAESLDLHVKTLEQSCARLMTMLKGIIFIVEVIFVFRTVRLLMFDALWLVHIVMCILECVCSDVCSDI